MPPLSDSALVCSEVPAGPAPSCFDCVLLTPLCWCLSTTRLVTMDLHPNPECTLSSGSVEPVALGVQLQCPLPREGLQCSSQEHRSPDPCPDPLPLSPSDFVSRTSHKPPRCLPESPKLLLQDLLGSHWSFAIPDSLFTCHCLVSLGDPSDSVVTFVSASGHLLVLVDV